MLSYFIANNLLGGQIPTEIGNIEKLEVISVGEEFCCSLFYNIVLSFLIHNHHIPHVSRFSFIASNLLGGDLTTEIGELEELEIINIGKIKRLYYE